jgi:hypothetical protein
LQISQPGERRPGFGRRLKKRSLRKPKLCLQKLRRGRGKRERRLQEME